MGGASALQLDAVVRDLLVRFIINSPPSDLASIERIGFLVEQAHWYFLDFYLEDASLDLPKLSLKSFAAEAYKRHPSLFAPFCDGNSLQSFSDEFSRFLKYKISIPVVGAIMMDDKRKNVILVRGYNSKKTNWTFPKGKITQAEPFEECAAREVYEETSVDIRPFLSADQFIEMFRDNQLIRLYIIIGIPKNIALAPRTRKEIAEIKWFPLGEVLKNGIPSVDWVITRLKKFMTSHFGEQSVCKSIARSASTASISALLHELRGCVPVIKQELQVLAKIDFSSLINK